MEACLKAGVSYLDTANYEPRDEAHFEYSWQWAYKKRFEDAGLTAILGCGFDPVYRAYSPPTPQSTTSTRSTTVERCVTTTRPSPPTSTPRSTYVRSRRRAATTRTASGSRRARSRYTRRSPIPNIGPRESYLMYHEELESLVKNFPSIRQARFWMTFGEEYLTHLRVIQNIGMAPHRRGRLQRHEDRTPAVPQGRAAQPAGSGRELRGRDLDRLPHTRCEGWQGAHILHLQQLLAPRSIPRDRNAGRKLHHGRCRP